ncbi:DUF423 domain-containing protein [Glaciecola sp. XM2]|jgi:uncharacterized membrane protein YgdD (TMEM256/DUF423 family)|uniref:DUF423 domain-containing protein n=1 Tax=Glaciecola sp. XM2 TaxID=1914931 RepID=UPI001BDE2934|nr:DUF423 domain-containing protein [Glaciecola sp. XM2]MBT1449458.1 DUF423 domain-containing protein [Glaciecola sp. XM2]
MNKQTKWLVLAGALFAMLSVAIGAFAAHGLKSHLDEYGLSIIETGARYQMYHALALLVLAALSIKLSSIAVNVAGICFVAGIICFSGSLYVLALTTVKWVVFVTPLGGLLFIVAWATLMYATITKKDV